MKEQCDRFNALNGFFKLQNKPVNIKSLFCPMSRIYKRLEWKISSHHTNAPSNGAGRFDTKTLTNLWHLIIFFFHCRVVNIFRCSPLWTSTPQHFIYFVCLLRTIHICTNASASSVSSPLSFAPALNNKSSLPTRNFFPPLLFFRANVKHFFHFLINSKTIHPKTSYVRFT